MLQVLRVFSRKIFRIFCSIITSDSETQLVTTCILD